MKILVVTSSFPRFQGDIAGRFVFEWARHLQVLGHELRILTWADSSVSADSPGDTSYFDVQRVSYAPAGYDTLFYGAGTPENIRENRWRALLAAPAVAAMMARVVVEIGRERPDIIVGHWLVPAGVLVRLCTKIIGIPSLIVGHSGGVHLVGKLTNGLLGSSGIGAGLAKFCASGAMTVPTDALAKKLGDLLGESGKLPRVLSMGFEPANELLSADLAPRQNSAQHWLCMGRLVEIKGVDLAIEAFCRADFVRPTTLHIAGDGPKRARLEALAKRLCRGREYGRVEFHGLVTGAAKTQLLERCGFALFCSKTLEDGRHEGLPISFLEAASHGIIPLCAQIPGLSDYVATPAQQTLYTRDIGAWSDRISRLVRLRPKTQLQLSQAQQARVATLAWPTLIREWDRLVWEVAAR